LKDLIQILPIFEKNSIKKRPFARILAFIVIVGPTSPKSQVKESKQKLKKGFTAGQ
jgi:hypothetical protein